MRLTKLFFLSLFIVAAISILWCKQSLSISEKKPLPTFGIPTLYSANTNLTNQDFLGKVALFVVWSSECECCRHEHNMLMQIKKNYAIPIYGLNFEDEPNSARAWIKQHGNPYVLVGVDEEGALEKNLGVTGTPETYIIDKHGFIRYRHIGEINQKNWNNNLWPMIQKLKKES